MPFMRKSRGILFAVAALAAAGCKPSEPAGNETTAPTSAHDSNVVETLPKPEPALDRAAFLQAVAASASAHTSGADDRETQSALDGRRFAIRLRFGCDGPAATDSKDALHWTVGPGETSIEVFAKPDLSLADEPLKSIPDQTIEAVEGFWIPRPWETSAACPADSESTEIALPTPQLVGIAQYFTAEDSRLGRRSGRPYVATQKIASPAELPRSGLILLLEGRFEAWPGGDVIRCTGSGRDRQPTCIASAHLDRAAFLRPEDSSVIAEWRD